MEIGLPEPYPTSTEYALGLATNPYLPWSLDLIENTVTCWRLNNWQAIKGYGKKYLNRMSIRKWLISYFD